MNGKHAVFKYKMCIGEVCVSRLFFKVYKLQMALVIRR